jgi:ATP-dependent helicase HrpA
LAELPSVAEISEAAAADLREQLGNLVFRGFLAATAYGHLVQLPRYLRAAQARISTLRSNPARDESGRAVILRCEDAYAELCALAPPGPLPDFVDEVGWLLEELRVSLFAQALGTAVPVSEKRVRSAMDKAAEGLR